MHTASTTPRQTPAAAIAQLLRLINSLNPESATIGAGMLAQLKAAARAACPEAEGFQTLVAGTPDQIAEAFTAWETGFRLDPTTYLTDEETRALDLADYGQRSGAYFTGLLRCVQGGAA